MTDAQIIAEDRAHLASLLWQFRADPEALARLTKNNLVTICTALLDTSVQPPVWSADMASAPTDRQILIGKTGCDGLWHCAVAFWDDEWEWWRTSSVGCFASPTHWAECPTPPRASGQDSGAEYQFDALDALPRREVES